MKDKGLSGVKNTIVVASGKGGVGKSTVTANLAVAFARQGFKVGLIDADIYGPSIPKMLGADNIKPNGEKDGEKDVFYPIEALGVKIMSIGFFIQAGQSLMWRGPMASNALTQMFEDTVWGEIDYMFVDFPPGTGDVQLTSVQKMNVSGAIMVTTPQDVAVLDAGKAANMFLNPQINIPIVGVVENMSWFTPEKHPDEKYFIFGKGGGEKMVELTKSKLLAQIPLVAEVGEMADQGKLIYSGTNKELVKIFDSLAVNISDKVK